MAIPPIEAATAMRAVTVLLLLLSSVAAPDTGEAAADSAEVVGVESANEVVSVKVGTTVLVVGTGA
jgi:hypothetical protein